MADRDRHRSEFKDTLKIRNTGLTSTLEELKLAENERELAKTSNSSEVSPESSNETDEKLVVKKWVQGEKSHFVPQDDNLREPTETDQVFGLREHIKEYKFAVLTPLLGINTPPSIFTSIATTLSSWYMSVFDPKAVERAEWEIW